MDEQFLPTLEELESFQEEISEKVKTAPVKLQSQKEIPIPSPDYLTKQLAPSSTENDQAMKKYEKEYEQFCRWAALPKDLRKPKTALDFERKHFLPRSYTQFFKKRSDFRTKTISYFWDWMMDVYPDVVYSVYQQSVNSKNMKAAAIFIDLLSKKMNLDKPRVSVQPMVLMGVPQDKIDKLFVPKNYETIIPEK